MEKIIAKLNAFLSQFCIVCKVPCDKQMHFLSGAILGIILTPFIGWVSILWVSAIACAKEIYDYIHPDKHTADIWDWVATTLGGILGTVLIGVLA